VDIYHVTIAEIERNKREQRSNREQRNDLLGSDSDSLEERASHQTERDSLFNYGKLQTYLDDESIEEIWINSPNRIFIAKNGTSHLAPIIISAQEIRDITERMLAWSGRRVDLSKPFVDARLPNGARLHVVIPDITAEYWALNIRKRILRAFSLSDLVAANSVSEEVAAVLTEIVGCNVNILVSGATHAGKTTILNSLLGALPPRSRLITLEEVFELTPRVADHVALQIRQENLEGNGEVSLRTLVREALRMRPNYLVIGEVRGAEALDLLLALNSGIPGMASIHANSSDDALRKITALPLLAGQNIVREFALEAVRENIDIVIHCKQDRDNVRRIVDVALVNKQSASNSLSTESLFHWDGVRYQMGRIDFDAFPKLIEIKRSVLALLKNSDNAHVRKAE
jgi:pilus assembly protein CpaF